MYKEEWIGLGVLVFGFLGFLLLVVLLITSADSSSWITYHEDGKDCITLVRSDNHTFSPDKTYTENWCK